MKAGKKGVLIGGALIATICFAAFSIVGCKTIANSSDITKSNPKPMITPPAQKRQERVIVLESANQFANTSNSMTTAIIPNSFELCKKHFNAITLKEFDEILANGGSVVGSPTDIRESSMPVTPEGGGIASLDDRSNWSYGEGVGYNLQCQMRDYIIER